MNCGMIQVKDLKEVDSLFQSRILCCILLIEICMKKVCSYLLLILTFSISIASADNKVTAADMPKPPSWSARAQFDAELDKAFEKSTVVIVVFGWPDICTKCQAFAEDYKKKAFPADYKFIGVDIATSPEIKKQFSIVGVPHFKFFEETSSKDLKLIGEFKGYEGPAWFLEKAAPIMAGRKLTRGQEQEETVRGETGK